MKIFGDLIPSKRECVHPWCHELCFSRKKFSDQHNLDVVTRLVSETSKVDSRVPLLQLRGMCYLYVHLHLCV